MTPDGLHAAKEAIADMDRLRANLVKATNALDQAEREFQEAQEKLRKAQLAQMIAVAAVGENADSMLSNIKMAFEDLLEAAE